VKLGLVAIEGTKIKANASKHKKAMSYARMTETEARLQQEVAALLRRAAEVDAAEDAQSPAYQSYPSPSRSPAQGFVFPWKGLYNHWLNERPQKNLVWSSRTPICATVTPRRPPGRARRIASWRVAPGAGSVAGGAGLVPAGVARRHVVG